MTRRAALMAAAVLAGCAKPPADYPFPDVAGAWTRTGRPETTTPPEHASRAWQATYRGPIAVRVTVAEMLSGPSAFEAMQRWRSEAGKLAFYRQQYFGIAESPGASAKDLDTFVRAFEEASGK